MRMLEILSYREKGNRREIRLQGILQFINTNIWRCLLGKVADSLRCTTMTSTSSAIEVRW